MLVPCHRARAFYLTLFALIHFERVTVTRAAAWTGLHRRTVEKILGDLAVTPLVHRIDGSGHGLGEYSLDPAFPRHALLPLFAEASARPGPPAWWGLPSRCWVLLAHMAGDDETTLSGMVRVARIPLATAYRGFVQLLDAGLVVRGTRSRGRRVAKPFRLTENGQRIGRLLVEVSNAFSATWFPEDA